MQHTWRVSTAVALCVMGTACTAAPGNSAVGSLSVEDCGVEETQHGTNYNAEGRQCLLDAFEAGRPAVFVSHAVTIEGAPIVTTYRVIEAGIVEVAYDGRQDPLGSQTIETSRCPRLVPVAEWNRVQLDTMPDEIVFVENGCVPLEG